MDKEHLIPDGRVIPIPEERRVSTDVICTIIGAIIALALFILACVFYSSQKINAAYFNFDQYTNKQEGSQASIDHYGFRVAFWATVLTAFGLGFIWLAIVHLAPRIAPHLAHILAIIALITLGVLTIVLQSSFFSNNGTWKWIVAIFCFVLAIIIFCMFWFYSGELRLQGIFLNYAQRFLHDWTGTFGYMVLFFVFMVAFIALIVFQHVAFSSKKHSNNNFWDFTNPGVLGILNILEFIWGFQFLRDAFNFCVAGSATDWYWNNKSAKCYTPLKRLFTRHWGSVVGGSFLNAFFEVPTLLIQLFTCHTNTCCDKAGRFCENKCCWGYFFNIVRTDSYGYINLTSLPFCNSGRACYDNCINNTQFVGGYNPMKHYRFVASVFLTTVGYLLGHIYADKRVLNLTWWHNVVLVIIVYAIICWFVDIDADAAEGISTSFFAEHTLANDYERMVQAQQDFKYEIQSRANREDKARDGHC